MKTCLPIAIPGLFLLLLSFGARAQQVQELVVSCGIADSLKQVRSLQRLNFKPAPVVGKDYYYRGLGLACKVEFKMEKATKVPLRFRLGSLQQTDYLEQKPNVQKP